MTLTAAFIIECQELICEKTYAALKTHMENQPSPADDCSANDYPFSRWVDKRDSLRTFRVAETKRLQMLREVLK